MTKKTKFYFDMDGCLAEFRFGSPFEELYTPNYFYSLEPNESIVETAKKLIRLKDIYPLDVYSLSAILNDHKTAKEEKIKWIEKHIPELDEKHRIFTIVGFNKSDYIKIDKNAVLIDDYSPNIDDFLSNGGEAVKVSRTFKDMIYEEKQHTYNHFINPEMSSNDMTKYLLAFVKNY